MNQQLLEDAAGQLCRVLPYLEQFRDNEARLPAVQQTYHAGVLNRLFNDTLRICERLRQEPCPMPHAPCPMPHAPCPMTPTPTTCT